MSEEYKLNVHACMLVLTDMYICGVNVQTFNAFLP